MSIRSLGIFCIAMAATAATCECGIVIEYKDVGSNIQFDYSGSLGYAATGTDTIDLGFVARLTYLNDTPVFASNPDAIGGASGVHLISHTAGRWATNLPANPGIGGYVARSGDSLLLQLNFDSVTSTAATGLGISGNWGAADTLISGSLTVAGSIASFGMVDGYTIKTTGGDITFQEFSGGSAVPEPASVSMWGLGALGLVIARRRKRMMVA